MIDHVSINVSDFDSAKQFYSKALQPLGYSLAVEIGEFAGFTDASGFRRFGLFRRDPVGGAHVAFACGDHKRVNAFYKAAIAAGGKDNGPPGIRSHYHDNFYGAF